MVCSLPWHGVIRGYYAVLERIIIPALFLIEKNYPVCLLTRQLMHNLAGIHILAIKK